MATEAQVQELAQAIQMLRQENAALAKQVETLKDEKKGGGDGTRKQGDAVDKLLKRTDNFEGTNFQDWKFRVETSFRPLVPGATKLLKWAEKEPTPIDQLSVDEQEGITDGTDELIYYFLTAACKGEAFDIVRNVPEEHGAEAWRKLCKRFGAKTRGRKVVLLRRCVNPAKIKKLSEAPALIEKWESDVRRLSADYKEQLSDGVMCGILLEMVPSNITEFLTQRMEEDDTYQDTKETVLRYVQTKADFSGPTPMDVDGFMEHGGAKCSEWEDEQNYGQEATAPMMSFGYKGGKGGHKGKGKGKGSGTFQGSCNLCGEWGHRAAQCQWGSLCFHCGQPGHILSQCPLKDAEMNGKGKDGYKGYGKGTFKGKGWPNSGKGWKGAGKGFGGVKGSYGKGGLHACWEESPCYGEGQNEAGDTSTMATETPSPVWGLFGLHQKEPNDVKAEGWQIKAKRVNTRSVTNPPGLPCNVNVPMATKNRFQTLTSDHDDDKNNHDDHENNHDDNKNNNSDSGNQVLDSGNGSGGGDNIKNKADKGDEMMLGLFNNEGILSSMGEQEEWVTLDTVVDSGAADSVAPMEMAYWLPLDPSPGSMRGQTWQSACGEVLPNLGERKIKGYTEEGEPVEAVYQIAEVSKALGSVTRTCDRGNRVVFEADGGYIENLASGRKTRFNRENNVYVMKTWVRRPAAKATARPSAVFSRQG